MNLKNQSSLKTIFVIGTDASGIDGIPKKYQDKILNSSRIAAPKRLIESIRKWLKDNSRNINRLDLFTSDRPKDLINWLKESEEEAIIISSGDPLWYGIGRTILEYFPLNKVEFKPSPTCLQLAFAKIGKEWQDAKWISLHGRDQENLIKVLKKRPKTLGILIDPNQGGANEVKTILNALGLSNAYEFWIFERLGHCNEAFFKVLPEEEIRELDPLHLVLLLTKKENIPNASTLPIFGLDDGTFYQYEDRPGLMTKKEVRVQVLAALELPEHGILWDIGSGVGSIGLEAIRLRPNIKLVAIDKRTGCKKLIRKNAKLLGVNPELIIESDALTIFEKDLIPSDFSKPDRIILGGGGLKRLDLLKHSLKSLSNKGIIIIPLVTIEAIQEITSYLKKIKCSFSITQLQVWRGVPLSKGTRLSPMNPITIIKIK